MRIRIPYLFIIQFLLAVVCFQTLLWASEPGVTWTTIETENTMISYESPKALANFQKSIQYGKGWWATTSSFSQFTHEENIKIAAMKTDAVFERAQEILGMKKKSKKVLIKIYSDKPALENAYQEFYKKKCPFRAWYEFRTHTISLNANDCNEGILAHEMAHSIIDNYLKVRPPRNTAEILAKYVDIHLK